MNKNIILIILVVALAVIPLFANKDAEFTGADNKAKEAITKINPNYKPWFKPLWKPPGGEIESLIFALQAAIGAGFIGYFIGHSKGKKESKNK